MSMRPIKWIVIGLLLVVIVAVTIVYVSLNRIVRSTVETQASSQLGVQTTLGGANVSLFGGNLSLSNLAIASPKGFNAQHMFTLGGTDVAVSLGQLTSEPVHITSVSIKKPTLVIEQQNMKLNFKALIDQMPTSPTTTDKTPSDQKPPMKLIIDRLTVNDATVVIRPGEIPGLKMPAEISIPIPSLDLENIGTGDGNQNGAAIKEVVTQVITAMAAKAAESGGLPPELKSLLSLDVNAISAQLGQQFNKQLDKLAGEVTKKLPKDIGGALETSRLTTKPSKAIEQGIKDLLNGNGGKKND